MDDPEPVSPTLTDQRSASMATHGSGDANTTSTSGISSTASKDQYYLGLGLLLVVVGLWVGSSFLMSSMFRDEDWNQPWLVTYICTSSFSLYLIKPAIDHINQNGLKSLFNIKSNYSYQKINDSKKREVEGDDQRINGPTDSSEEDDENTNLKGESYRGKSTATGPKTKKINRSRSVTKAFSESERPLRVDETAKLASTFVLLWFAANWTVNAALGFTSVSSTTILSSMSGFFTLILGSMIGVEKLNIIRFVAVIASITGVILVSSSDHQSSSSSDDHHKNSHPVLGDLLALSSAGLYAVYVILMKVKVKDESRVNMQLFFGFVGIINLLFFWPIGVLLDYTGLEVFELPKSSKLWVSVLINAMCTFTSDYIYMLAMLKTSPLVVTLGLSLTLPVAVAGDIFKGVTIDLSSFIGALLVLSSFGILSVFDKDST
ncbi:hypothetical protein PPACK8108_LOCUS25336 [Phakopsora pachyrhizi]|uniref:EamA domain-containing protein n=1 Tax=Phakopsora pachyrhizi TaxID=170000 RepID=A0AAV0BUV3_PHAPC|nr:hypothetical protein PPACK8108_LOCUS25336 [Phakopsora pachyrhizi]